MPDTTVDDFLGGRLEIRQPAKGFRAGLDAVILAASVPAASFPAASFPAANFPAASVPAAAGPRRVLDVGAGVGTAGLCVAARLPETVVTLVEISPVLTTLARGNVEANGLAGRVRVVEADIGAPAAQTAAAGLLPDHFDEVIANPPYLDAARHRLPEDATAAAAFGMAAGELERWARFMARVTVPGGHATVIHRADALGELLVVLSLRFGGIVVLPIYPRDGEPAHRVVVRGKRGSRAPMSLLAGLVLHGEGNAFRPEVAAVLRDGVGLDTAVGSWQSAVGSWQSAVAGR